ncbi:hypothetical protein BEP19_15605 [Ammoniphilus oxalaticus]|uniref:Uncharacterized protein n=1 Tax=Ammoniphilus oxalaticus TaxID=66863 RepID=A0A419SDB1_9BACL|nr:hypothetical protein [Ammoniphilus oxalaticus]RKD21099.1 hypothetical protein BEP19_15605 [Ammoniphilus oxalaticus]
MTDFNKRAFTAIGKIGAQTATDHVQLMTLFELLVEKGVLSREEFDKKFMEIYQTESRKIQEFFLKDESE